MGIVTMLIVGLLAGLLARFLMPGRDPMGFVATTLLGIVGSFLGGFISSLLTRDEGSFAEFHPAGLAMSVVGALIVLGLHHLFSRRRAHHA